MLAFTVFGVPIPKGSAKAFRHRTTGVVIVTHDNARTKPWQECVVSAALDAVGTLPLGQSATGDGEPVALELAFYLPRPKSAPKRVVRQVKKPDLDKLVRCVKDALTRAGVYHDDAQVVRTVATKEFAGGERDPRGAAGLPRVEVRVLGDEAAMVEPNGSVPHKSGDFVKREAESQAGQRGLFA